MLQRDAPISQRKRDPSCSEVGRRSGLWLKRRTPSSQSSSTIVHRLPNIWHPRLIVRTSPYTTDAAPMACTTYTTCFFGQSRYSPHASPARTIVHAGPAGVVGSFSAFFSPQGHTLHLHLKKLSPSISRSFHTGFGMWRRHGVRQMHMGRERGEEKARLNLGGTCSFAV